MRSMLLLAAFAFAFATGCNTTTVENDDDEVEENDGVEQGEDSGNAWDGVAWISVGHGHRHRAGCGHHHHHGVWNIHPANHVFGGRHHHFKARVVRHHKKKH